MTTPAHLISEAELSETVKELAALNGFYGYHTYNSQRSQEGFWDWTFLGNGRLLGVELKKEDGKLTRGAWALEGKGKRARWKPGQEDWLEQLRQVSQPPEAYLWRPSDLLSGKIEAILSKTYTPVHPPRPSDLTWLGSIQKA